jgi:hypothetical protein
MSGRRPSWWKVVVGLGLLVGGGCQTWVPEAGLTLPTGHYLDHPPQFIPPSPPYPHTRELAAIEAANAAQAAGQAPPALLQPAGRGGPAAPPLPPAFGQ